MGNILILCHNSTLKITQIVVKLNKQDFYTFLDFLHFLDFPYYRLRLVNIFGVLLISPTTQQIFHDKNYVADLRETIFDKLIKALREKCSIHFFYYAN